VYFGNEITLEESCGDCQTIFQMEFFFNAFFGFFNTFCVVGPTIGEN